MKNKIKKIVTASVISAMSLTALGLTTNSQNDNKINEKQPQNYSIMQNIEKTSATTQNKNIGKIVETSTNNQIKYISNGRQIQFLNNDISEAEIENNLTFPQDIGGFNLFILSTTPYICYTNDNNDFKINVKFADTKIETQNTNEKPTSYTTNAENKEKMNTYNLKRSILLIYANEIYNNNVNLSNTNKTRINSYIETISNSNDNSTTNLNNKISAIDSIINIIESNLNSNSNYYQRGLNSNLNYLNEYNGEVVESITETSTNQEIAGKIACVLNGKCSTHNNTTISDQTKQQTIEQNQPIIQAQENQNTTETQRNTPVNNTTKNNNAYIKNNLTNRRRNNIQQNTNINSSANDIMEEKLNTRQNLNNNYRNNNMQETKTMRADRTNENLSQEKYTNTNNSTEINRATRVPYQSTTNNFHR